jgi:hypothetical protein
MNATENPVITDRTSIIAAVQRLLDSRRPGGMTLVVEQEGVRQDQDWWYVPVRPTSEPPKRRYEYYEALAEIENELQKSDHLTVLFVPLAPYSINFRFRKDTSDEARSKVWYDLYERFSGGAIHSGEQVHKVSPDSDYCVIVPHRAVAESVAKELRASQVIDAESVTVKPEETSLTNS